MVELKYYLGVVVNPDDSTCEDKQQLGRCQIRVHPEMKDVADDMLPWMRPFEVSIGQLSVPSRGSLVWCISTDEYAKSWFYGGSLAVDDEIGAKDTMSQIQGVVAAAAYPSTRFWRALDGTVFFCDGVNKVTGIIHSSGAQFTIDGNGDIIVKGSQKVVVTGGSANLGDVLISLATEIINLATPGNLLSAPPGVAVMYPMTATAVENLEMVKTKSEAFKT